MSSSVSVVCYPQSFLERPVDRLFLVEMRSAGVSDDAARLILYRIWADFATGGSDRRKLGVGTMAELREVRILESFCGWTGKPGELVTLGIASGFLRTEPTDDGEMLVCTGFYPLNSAFSAKGTSFQRRGGLTLALKKHAERAREDAKNQVELWQRTNARNFTDVEDSLRDDAIYFIHRVCRACNLSAPTNQELAAGCFRMAVDCVREALPEHIDRTLMLLLTLRNDPALPNRLDAVLREWAKYTARAEEELK